MLKKLFILLLLVAIYAPLTAQNEDYARKILKTLCSPEFHGRGYAFGGDSLAAEYLCGEFKSLGIKPIMQPFALTANVFDKDAYIVAGKDTLKAGRDFVVNPANQSVNCNIKFSKDFRKSDSMQVSDITLFAVDKLPPQGIADHQNKNAKFYVSKALIHNKKRASVHLDAQLKHGYITHNIIGIIPGETDTFKVITAHYDHVGTLGRDVYFPGAHDNASGTAMVMDLAREFANMSPQHYSLAFILFSGEELGLFGSYYYTRNPYFPLSKIKTLINLDMLGSGDEGIMVVNGSVLKDEFDFLVNINNTNNYVPKIQSRGEAANSDHYFFYKKGVKSLYIYTLGTYKEYHNIYDRAEIIPMPAYNGIFNLVKDFVTDF